MQNDCMKTYLAKCDFSSCCQLMKTEHQLQTYTMLLGMIF